MRSCKTDFEKKSTIGRRHVVGPYKVPLMPPLPTERVSASAPFTYTGVDYFGSLLIKAKKKTQVWVCLLGNAGNRPRDDI